MPEPELAFWSPRPRFPRLPDLDGPSAGRKGGRGTKLIRSQVEQEINQQINPQLEIVCKERCRWWEKLFGPGLAKEFPNTPRLNPPCTEYQGRDQR